MVELAPAGTTLLRVTINASEGGDLSRGGERSRGRNTGCGRTSSSRIALESRVDDVTG